MSPSRHAARRSARIITTFEATAASGLDGFAATPYGPALARYEQISKTADRLRRRRSSSSRAARATAN